MIGCGLSWPSMTKEAGSFDGTRCQLEKPAPRGSLSAERPEIPSKDVAGASLDGMTERARIRDRGMVGHGRAMIGRSGSGVHQIGRHKVDIDAIF